MVLADTNIFIDFWNNPTKELVECFENEDIVICGVIELRRTLHHYLSERCFA
jgi:hypothetical protein